MNSKASVYTAECVAIDDALDIAKQNPDCNFLIFSDSQSALQALNSNKISISTNQYILYSIKKKFSEIRATNSTIKFHWIPSHIRIHGNEEVDSLAKQASESQDCVIKRGPFSDLYEY